MPIEIVVPRLGWSMDEGTFGEWLKQDGEQVNAGDMLFVLEGEKASQEIESFDAGRLHIPPDAPQPGDTVAVGQLLGYLLAAGEEPPAKRAAQKLEQPMLAAPIPARRPAGGPAMRRRAREHAARQAREAPTPPAPAARRRGSRVVASPRARRTARKLGVDWSRITGTGRHGRIRERDVIALAEQSRPTVLMEPPPTAPGTQQPASKIRRTIAQRMLAGVQQTAPVTLTTKVDAAALVALRERLKTEHVSGTAPSYNDILVKLVSSLLPECPELNACWRGEGVYLYNEINIAVAIDTEAGLVAPVIKNVASLSLDQIAEQSRSLAERASAGRLSQNELEGGTFTITNLGMFDIDFFTPIINLPQCAILGVGRIVCEPVVVDDSIVPGDRLGLSLTFDHRVIDGAPAARWLQRLGRMIAGVDHWL